MVQLWGCLHRSQEKFFYKVQDFAHRKDIGRHARFDQKIASLENIQATFSGDEIASCIYHECKCKKPSRRAQGLGMQMEEHC
jgi:hypothetical protein